MPRLRDASIPVDGRRELAAALANPGRDAAFRAFLAQAGAEILKPTNPWEALRIRANGETSVAYVNKAGAVSVVGDALLQACVAWRTGRPWSGATKTPRVRQRSPYVAELLRRDGAACFYCAGETGELTIEHLVAVAHGGPNHLSNLVLACTACNRDAGHMSAMDKIRLRELRRRSMPHSPD